MKRDLLIGILIMTILIVSLGIVSLFIFTPLDFTETIGFKKTQNPDIKINDTELDLYGRILANWANTNQQVILINNEPINEKIPLGNNRYTIKWGLTDNAAEQKSTLEKALKNINCSSTTHLDYLKNLNPLTPPTALQSSLSCMGKITFQ